MAGNIVIRILGDSTGLGRALNVAKGHIDNMHNSFRHLNKSLNIALAGIAGIGAAGIGSGAVGMVALVAGAGAAAGALGYLALQNEEVSNSFDDMKERFKSISSELTKPMHVPMMDFFSDLTTIFQDRLGPSITRMSEMMGPFLDKLSTSLGTVAESFGSLLETMLESGEGAFFSFVDGLNPVLKGLEELFKTLDDPAISEFIKTFMDSLGELLPALGELMVALAPVGTEFLEILTPAIKDFATFCSDTLVPIMLDITGFLKEHPGLITTLVAAWLALKAGLMATHLALGLIHAAKVALMVLRVPMLAMTAAWTAAQWLLNASFMGFPLVWIIAAIVAVIAAVWLIVTNWDKVKEWLGKAWDWIKEKFSEVWNNIVNFFKETWEKIKNKVTEAIDNIKQKVSDGFNNVKSKVEEIINNVLNYLRELPSKFLQIGKDLIQGLIDGVGNMAGALKEKAKSVAQGALNSIKSFFGIRSPSRVMKEMGGYVGEGFVLGLVEKESEVARAAKSMGQAVTKQFDSNSKFQRTMQRAFNEVGLTAINGIDDLEKMLLRSDITWENLSTGYGRDVLDGYIKEMNRRGASNGGGVHITVNAGISSPEETGRTVVKAIRDYERINGNGWRS